MVRGSVLYFHSPCFDGIVSAVLAADYLERSAGWLDPELIAVNYHLRPSWLAPLQNKHSAIVDFLYHPDAVFWADHHGTTFLEDGLREHFRRRRDPMLVYDQNAPSCAGLLWRQLAEKLGHVEPRFAELVRWAEKTDSAGYDSPSEAVFGDAPALRISMGLALGDQGSYCAQLVRALRDSPLEVVAELPEVKRRYESLRALTEAGLKRFRRSATLEADGIVVFDVDGADVSISRYAPYLFFPEARYSAGIVRHADGAKVTAMRNPWLDFENVPLGPICAQLGGGGHRRVGSIALSGAEAGQAAERLQRLLRELRRLESLGTAGQPHAAAAS